VHWVSPDVDGGKIIAQDFVMIDSDDTERSLHEKIKQKEQILYPKVLQSLLLG
jgi:phosphoribosylglycinamide formyltransferase-1